MRDDNSNTKGETMKYRTKQNRSIFNAIATLTNKVRWSKLGRPEVDGVYLGFLNSGIVMVDCSMPSHDKNLGIKIARLLSFDHVVRFHVHHSCRVMISGVSYRTV